jgi:hypothetical protein
MRKKTIKQIETDKNFISFLEKYLSYNGITDPFLIQEGFINYALELFEEYYKTKISKELYTELIAACRTYSLKIN